MPVNLQQLQSLVGVSSLSEIKINDSGQLEKRSGIRAFFAKIGDFFQGLSASGRAAIAARNEAVVLAMHQAVNEARADPQPQAQQLHQRLSAVTADLTRAAEQSKQAAIDDIRNGLRGDKKIKALPTSAKQALESALSTMIQNTPAPEWSARVASLKNYFLERLPPGADIDAGLQGFKTKLIQDFLTPVEQNNIGANGIHNSFNKDAVRHTIKQIGDTAMEENQPLDYYETAFRNIVGEEHKELLPFLSMMASQAGMDGSLEFLPVQAGVARPSLAMYFTEYGLMPINSKHGVSLSRDGDDLLISSRFSVGFNSIDEISRNQFNTESALTFKGTATLRVHLSTPPSTHTVNGKTVLVPHITMESGEMSFTTTQGAEQP